GPNRGCVAAWCRKLPARSQVRSEAVSDRCWITFFNTPGVPLPHFRKSFANRLQTGEAPFSGAANYVHDTPRGATKPDGYPDPWGFQDSSQHVTGPSLTSATCISAPNIPLSTRDSRSAASFTIRSKNLAPVSGSAAPVKLALRPL